MWWRTSPPRRARTATHSLPGSRSPAIKDRLKEVTNDAVERGIFGSPFFLVDGEPFWGHDRMDEVDRWLASGGW